MSSIKNSDQREGAKRYGQIVARAWADDDFRGRLLSTPSEVLKETGFDVPEGKKVAIIEMEDNTIYFPLPPKPIDAFSDVALGEVPDLPKACCSYCGTCIELCLCWDD